MAKTRKPEKFLLRVIKGALVPVDSYTAARLRDKGYAIDDILAAQLTKPRNPKFHRMIFALLNMLQENVEEFDNMSAHDVLVRLQLESGVACKEVWIKTDFGMAIHRQALSISFAQMDQGDFKKAARGLSRHIAAKYWPTLDAKQIEEMAGVMVDE